MMAESCCSAETVAERAAAKIHTSLDAIAAGQPVAAPQTQAIDCSISGLD